MNQTPYHARQRRRDKNSAWAVNAQARLKAWENKQCDTNTATTSQQTSQNAQ